jgi:hypothetical protein
MDLFSGECPRPSTGPQPNSFGAGMNSEKAANVDRWTNGGHQWR